MPTFRPASPADLDAAFALVSDAIAAMRACGIEQWDEIYPTRSHLAADIGAERLHLLLDDGILVAIGCLDDEQPAPYAEVAWTLAGPVAVAHRVAVAPTAQGRGYGALLMQGLEELAWAQGYRCIRLDAFCANPGACRLYEKLGYRRAGRVRFRKGPFSVYEKAAPDTATPPTTESDR